MDLDKVAEFQKVFKHIYDNTGLTAIRNDYVQLTESEFVRCFDIYDVVKHDTGWVRLEAYYNGVKFISIKEVEK